MQRANGIPKFSRIKNQPLVGLYASVLLVIIILLIALPQFRTARNLSNILLRAVPLLAVSTGQTIVLLGAGIDLSVGAVLALATTIASVSLSVNIVGGIFLVLLCGMAVGFVNGLGVTKLRINPFIMTIGTTIITGGIALYIRPYPGGMIPGEFVNFVLAKTEQTTIQFQ